MRLHESGRYVFQHFDTLFDMISVEPLEVNQPTYKSLMNNPDFVYPIHERANILKYPDMNMLRALEAMVKTISGAATLKQETVTRVMTNRLDSGDEISPEYFMTRDFDLMWSEKRKRPHDAKFVKVAIDVGALARINPDETLLRAATGYAFAQWLVNQGYHVSLDTIWCTQDPFFNRETILAASLHVADGRNLNLLNICAVSNLLNARALFFAARLGLYQVKPTLGHSFPADETIIKALDIDVILPNNLFTETQCADWLAKAQKKVGQVA